jgi:RNA polymerase sigma factor (sigma-70 family)
MAIIVELIEVAEGIYEIRTTQVADEDGNAEWELVQQVEDERSTNEFERLEVRDTLRVLLEKTPLAPREREVISLILQGEDNFAEIAQRLGVTRSRVWDAFRSAVRKLRRSAEALGITP